MRTFCRFVFSFIALLPVLATADEACERLVVEYRRTTPLGTVSFDQPAQLTKSGTVCVSIADNAQSARWSIEWEDGKVYRSWTLVPDKPTTKRKDGMKAQFWSRFSSDYNEETMQGRGENLVVVSSRGKAAMSGLVIILNERLAMSWSSMHKADSDAEPAKELAPSRPAPATTLGPRRSTSL